jgi:hypothetical protein
VLKQEVRKNQLRSLLLENVRKKKIKLESIL